MSLGVFGGLRRCADDAGRFLLLDLDGAMNEVLADLTIGLAPFATGVVLAPDQLLAWHRDGIAATGRIVRVANAAALADARCNGADAVLAPPELHIIAAELALARLGDDEAADLGLAPRDDGPWIESVAAPQTALPPGAVGYLATAPFWQRPVLHAPSTTARRELIADDLVPRLQTLNAAALDLPLSPWLDAKLVETSR